MESRANYGNDIREQNRQKRMLRQKIHRMRVLAMTAAVTLAVTMGVAEISYIQSGSISVETDGYSVINEERERRADAAAALNMADSGIQKIDITIPDYCPVNYTARSPIAMVYDKTTGSVLYSKNENEKCYPASTVKLITAAVALDLAADDFKYVAGGELDLIQDGASLAKINKCYALNTSELMDAMIMKGGSDASYIAAANIGRLLCDNDDVASLEAVNKFVDVMNSTASAIGCTATHFTNPDGFFDAEQYTTGKDMMKIAIYASEHEEIMTAAGKAHSGGKLLSGQTYEWVNSNKMMIETSSDYYEYATGLKTGMTENSGYCIAATAEQYGHELVCIVMNAPSAEDRTFDVKALFDISFSYLSDIGNAETETY